MSYEDMKMLLESKNDLGFIEYNWVDYSQFRYDIESKHKQAGLLIGSGLCEGEHGIEYTFIPTKSMLMKEQKIMDLYHRIRIDDAEVQICNEVFYTNKIEGANTTILRTQQIHNGNPVDASNWFSEKMIENGFKATKYLNLIHKDLTDDILINLWNIVVDGVCDNDSIRSDRYRVGDVCVGKHTALDYRMLEDVMPYWISYYNKSYLDNHPFIKAALLHYSYEHIHPFCDGNGRTGRLLMINYLIKNGWEKFKAIAVSRYIEKDLQAYYQSFDLSDNVYSDCTPFIEYMLNIFLDAIYSILKDMEA